MELDTVDNILRAVANGETMDYAQWPDLLSRLIPRLEKIVYNEFPIPRSSRPSPSDLSPPLPPLQVQSKTDPASQHEISGQNIGSAQSADKENDPRPAHTTTLAVGAQPVTLPPQILSLLNSVTQTLKTSFSQYPPHTIQRLAELILSPRAHYRNLPSYIHAVDRVAHVTSPANVYPLPAAVPDAFNAKPLINGVGPSAEPSSISWGTSTQVQPSLGSDESLGGALLTPIPWLSNRSTASSSDGNSHIKELEREIRTENTETIDGPNGAGSIETVSVSVNGVLSTLSTTTSSGENVGGLRAEGGVTQGELLRQEQRAGVVPASQYLDTRASSGMEGVNRDDDEIPHARGPEEIGIEDTGPQVARNVGIGMQGIDVEAAVGRRAEGSKEAAPTVPKREAGEDMEREGKKIKDGVTPSTEEQAASVLELKDREMALADADGQIKGEAKIGDGKGNAGADVMDTTAV